ncbi:hypothetical protein CFIMG_003445RAa [Ceratocystis fimbriata CBS 114723]|uniref:FCH domain-containing protein n=1 Tax=Ceratocystis fimbriata CBS 114723 TaxID=1035309 RepID=A0A2C5XJ12_9PEZI|nr:hypothetical protein CFIMG_003445RAa [Ceratocystis fimbriata CBS 114723]
MDSLSKSEYAAMLPFLQPTQAVSVYNDRLKRVLKFNHEVTDWLQERRKVEEQYVSGLRKLSAHRVPNPQSELGVFREAWDKIVESVEQTAAAHHQLAASIDMEIETPLRSFSSRDDVRNLNTIHANLVSMARELDDAQEKTEKLSKKGAKTQAKMEQASARLEAAISQWESQAPFVFESLQVADEARVNQMRNLLTQYETMDLDCSQRSAASSTNALNLLLEVSTQREIDQFVHRTTSGRVKPVRSEPQSTNGPNTPSEGGAPSVATETRMDRNTQGQTSANDRPPQTPISVVTSPQTAASTPAQVSTPASRAAPSIAPTTSHGQAPPTSSSTNASFHIPAAFAAPPVPPIPSNEASHENYATHDTKPDLSLRSRLGNMLGRRRQSIQGGFAGFSPISTQKPGRGMTGNQSSSNISPRPSLHDISSGHAKLSSLSEDAPAHVQSLQTEASPINGNGYSKEHSYSPMSQSNGFEGSNTGTPSSPHAPPHEDTNKASSPTVDSEGYTIKPNAIDPITLAQQEAANAEGHDNEQLFKLNIQNKPISEEDPEEQKAAITNVASALSMQMPAKRAPTVRGRREVRNTIYMPSPVQQHDSVGEALGLPAIPPSPSIPEKFQQQQQQQQTQFQKPPSLAALSSDSKAPTGGSDTLSVRSGTSMSGARQFRHPELTGEGLSASIVEMVAATFAPSGLKSIKMSGEIAFGYKPTEQVDRDKKETVLINNFTNLEAIGPNRIFVHPSMQGRNDQYSLDVSYLNRTTTAFTYRVHSEIQNGLSLAHNLPLSIEPNWTTRGDTLNLRIMLNIYQDSKFEELSLKNVAISVNYKGLATGVKSKPTGTHLKERHIVYWRMAELHLQKGVPHKVICQIAGANSAPTPGHIDANWEYTPQNATESLAGISISRLEETKGKGIEVEDDPFADEATSESSGLPADMRWSPIPLAIKVVSGKYEAVYDEEPSSALQSTAAIPSSP